MTMLWYLLLPFYNIMRFQTCSVHRSANVAHERTCKALENLLRVPFIPNHLRSTKGQRRTIRLQLDKVLGLIHYASKAALIIPALTELIDQLTDPPSEVLDMTVRDSEGNVAVQSIAIYMMGRHDRNVQHGSQDQGVTNRIPPAWAPEWERSYSFQQYCADLLMWIASTDIDEARQGPTVAMRLQGGAKVVMREMDPNQLVNGVLILDPAGGFDQNGQPNRIHITGVQFLLRHLKRRYAPLDQEVQIQAIADLFHFRRLGGETTDDVICRFELAIHRAANQGQVVIGEPIQAWMLLSALAIPRDKWSLLLAPTLGALPTTVAQHTDFVAYIRRQGHLYDHDRNKTIQQQFYGQQTSDESYNTYQSYPTFQANDPSYASYPTFPSPYGYPIIPNSEDPEEEYELSSGCSNDDEPVDFSDVQAYPLSIQGEWIYLGYRTAKRKFRKFTRQPGRSFRSKGKGRGKGGSKGKGKMTFWTAEGIQMQGYSDEGPSDDMFSYPFVKGGKGGKGGKGVRKGNPIGADGKVMTCSGCGSEEHFVRFCPKATAKGGKGKGTYFDVPSTVHWSSQPGMQPGTMPVQGQYFGASGSTELRSPEFQPCIEYADGTVEALSTTTALFAAVGSSVSPKAVNEGQLAKLWQFPLWHSQNYHTTVRLANGREGILIDCGAIDHMAGSKVMGRMIASAAANGQGSVWSDIKPISVEGVGQEATIVNQACAVPLCLATGDVGEYKAIVAPQSELPALYGLCGLRKNAAIIDVGNNRMIYPGPGGIKFTLSPGSRVHKLEEAVSGHLLLPCCEWQAAKTSNKASISLL